MSNSTESKEHVILPSFDWKVVLNKLSQRSFSPRDKWTTQRRRMATSRHSGFARSSRRCLACRLVRITTDDGQHAWRLLMDIISCTVIHFVQAAYYRLWFLFPSAVLAGIGETIGWVGRLWSSQNPLLTVPFEME